MVINNPEWLELTDAVESFMRVNGLIMSNQTNTTVINPQAGGGVVDWNQTQNIQNATIKNFNKARAVLITRPNSHPFQPRTLHLEANQEVKVGRSLARNRVSESNAIFDCKVLSRNHAVIWYSDGKFYIKDTGSSNGTFINNQRLSQGSATSEPFEVCSNDVVQFGVDVTENSRKETHGCIVATLKLFLPDGRETKASASSLIGVGTSSIPPEDLCRLNQYIQEAVQREQILETKLLNLQKIVELTRKNSTNNWQAMIDEDRLLSRIDILENKLQCFQKNSSEDKLREEILKLQEDKSDYQNSAKEALRKVYQEHSEALKKLTTIERALCSSEDECSLLRDQLYKNQQSLQEVTARLSHIESNFSAVKDKIAQDKIQENTETQNMYAQLKQMENEANEMKDKMAVLIREKEELLSRVALYQYCENLTNSFVDDTDDDPDALSKVRQLLSTATELENENHDDDESDDDTIRTKSKSKDVDNFFLKYKLIEERLSHVQKNLIILQERLSSSTIKSTTFELNSDFLDIISDGNQNLDQQTTETIEIDTNRLMKEVVAYSWMVYMELVERTNFFKRHENDIPRAIEEQYKLKINDLEKQIPLLEKSENEILNESVKSEENGEIITNNYDNSVEDEIFPNELTLLKIEIDELRTEISKNDLTKKLLENELLEAKKSSIIKFDKSSQINIENNNDENIKEEEKKDDLIIVKSNANIEQQQTNVILTNFDKSINDDIKIQNDQNVQREEELIMFKEKYNEATNENLKLKQDLIKIQKKYDYLKNKSLLNIMIYLSPIIALLGYLFFSFYT